MSVPPSQIVDVNDLLTAISEDMEVVHGAVNNRIGKARLKYLLEILGRAKYHLDKANTYTKGYVFGGSTYDSCE